MSDDLRSIIDDMFGVRRVAGQCVNPPIGCGGPATEFKNELSMREYKISGLCQKCQDKVFTPNPEDEGDPGQAEDDYGPELGGDK